MADNTPRWIREARRIAPIPAARPIFTPAATTRPREVTQAQINRIRAEATATKKAKT